MRLKQAGLSAEQIQREMELMESFHLQLKAELEGYERWKLGEFEAVEGFHGLGSLLVALRIAQGIAERELAERLGLPAPQVSRYEVNSHSGITPKRGAQILDAIQARFHTTVELRLRPTLATT